MAETGKLSPARKRKPGQASASKSLQKKPKVDRKDKSQPFKKKEISKFTDKGGKPDDSEPRKGSSSVVLDRRARKVLAEERKKKRKPNYDLEKIVIGAWEKLRQRKVEANERTKLTSELIKQMKGKLSELAVSHTCSRVVQSCVKHCTAEERAAMFEELKPHCLPLAQNTYAHHLVNKMLEHGTREQRNKIIPILYGHVVPLLRHPVASHVVEQAFQLASAAQKHALLSELYSPEHKLFKDGASVVKPKKLSEVLAESGEAKKRSILEHFALAIQPIVEKGIVDHSIVHKALNEFLSCAPQRLWTDAVEQLSGPLMVRMLHTRDGASVAAKCISAGSAKERKKIVKALKDHVLKIAMDDHGYLVLLQIFEVVDDTTLVRKTIISELMKDLKSLATHKNGSRVLLHFLAPKVPRYFQGDVIAVLNEAASRKVSAADETEEKEEEEVEAEAGEEGEGVKKMGVSKKDPEVRRRELLHDSQLDQALVKLCMEGAEEILRSRFGTDLIFEVCNGGVDGALHKSHSTEVSELQVMVANLAKEPRGRRAEAAEAPAAKQTEAVGRAAGREPRAEHILDDFFASRTIRRLVSQSAPPSEGVRPFAAVLWELALKGRCEEWASGHSAKVVAAVASCADEATKQAAIRELMPLAEKGLLKSLENLLPEELRDLEGHKRAKTEGKGRATPSRGHAAEKTPTGKKMAAGSKKKQRN